MALQMVCETAYLASQGFWFMFLSIIALVAFVMPAAATAAEAPYLGCYCQKKSGDVRSNQYNG